MVSWFLVTVALLAAFMLGQETGRRIWIAIVSDTHRYRSIELALGFLLLGWLATTLVDVFPVSLTEPDPKYLATALYVLGLGVSLVSHYVNRAR